MAINFIEKKYLLKAKNGCKSSLYKLYNLYFDKRQTQTIGVSYLQKFLLFTPPHLVKIIISEVEDRYITDKDFEETYIYLLTLVTAYAFDSENFITGVYWAKKVMEMVNYFHPSADQHVKEKILSSNCYRNAVEMFECHKQYFDKKIFDGNGVPFPWQEDLYNLLSPENDNLIF